MSDVVIINPRFNVSFWGMEKCMGLLGKRANLPVACLPLLAALVPDHHSVAIIDENVEDRMSKFSYGELSELEESRADATGADMRVRSGHRHLRAACLLWVRSRHHADCA